MMCFIKNTIEGTHWPPYMIGYRLWKKFFPNEQDKEVARWWADGGDYALRFNYDLDSESLVIDLGGYEGQWTSDLFSRYCCQILVFEPVRTFADRIRERFRKNEKIMVYQFGLGHSSRTESMGICASGSSIFRHISENEEVEIVDAAQWFANENIQHVHLMKINIEGGEYELLERLIETGLIKNIKDIQVQFHDLSRDSVERMDRIKNNLMQTHTSIYQYRFVWESWTRKTG